MSESRMLAPLDAAQRYSIAEACQYLRASRDNVYRKIRRGELRTLRDGRRRYVPGSEIARVSTLAAAEPPAP